MKRKAFTKALTLDVLTESGYRCAVPTCRGILAIDIHHLVRVSEDGGNVLVNLLALCPTCHALFHRGTISRDSIYAWKLILVGLSRAYDVSALDDLLFLKATQKSDLLVSGDGVLKFSHLIAGGLAEFKLAMRNGPMILYQVLLTNKGNQLVDAWQSGNRQAVVTAMGKTGT